MGRRGDACALRRDITPHAHRIALIAVSSNLRDAKRDGRLPWLKLLPLLALIATGIALVNSLEMAHFRAAPAADLGRYVMGALLAVVAVVCWTWYALRNADWLRAHADRSPRIWATAQGVVTLPLALLGYAGFWLWNSVGGSNLPMPFGPTPLFFLGLMFTIGLLSSWVGTLCWNEASQRLPTTLVGQLIVFETLAALDYAFVLRGRLPEGQTLLGIALLVAGGIWALRVKPEPQTRPRVAADRA